MANYVSTTKTWSLSDTYSDGAECGVTLTVTVDASGNGSYTLYTDKSANGSSQTALSIVLRVFSASTTMANGDYTTGTALVSGYYQNWGKWPNKAGTSTTGTFSLPGGASAASFKVDFAICAAQAATLTSKSGRLDNGTAARLGSSGNWGATFTRTPATYTVTFNANGGNTPSPTSKTVTSGSTYGTLATCTRNDANNYRYTFAGWYTAASGGTQVTSSTTVSLSGAQTLYAHWTSTLLTSACGTPTVTVHTSGDNYFYVKSVAGADGVSNAVSSVELFVTLDGSTPTTTNFQLHRSISCTAGQTKYTYFYPGNWTSECIEFYFGTDGVGTIKAVARTRGAAGESFYSGMSSAASVSYTHINNVHNGVKLLNPSSTGIDCGCKSGEYLTITWEDPDSSTDEYIVELWDIMANSCLSYDYCWEPCYSIETSLFVPGSVYQVRVSKHNYYYTWETTTYSTGLIFAKDVQKFGEPSVRVLPGSFPCVKPYWRQNEERMLFVNNGKGNICKLSWPHVSATNNRRRGYEVHINFYSGDDSQVTQLTEFIGDVNEYYLKASVINDVLSLYTDSGSTPPKILECSIEIIAKSAYGEAYDSEPYGARLYSINGSGIYVKTGESGGKPVMKRAIAFVNKENSGWHFVYDISKKDEASNWSASDTWYEAITDQNNEFVLDPTTDEIIYSL